MFNDLIVLADYNRLVYLLIKIRRQAFSTNVKARNNIRCYE